MIGVLNKKLLRDLWQSRTQAAAVAVIVACGVATYIAINSAYRNLLLTRDTYYEQYRFADFEIMVDRAPQSSAFKLEAIPGVRSVRARIVQDVNVDIEDVPESRTGRIVSMPDRPRPVLNDIHLMKGRYFEPGQLNEVILSSRFAESNKVNIGDNIDVSIDRKKHTLNVVGFALSPEYVYLIRNVQELVPSPERFGILWVPEDFAETALDLREACNNLVGTVDDEKKLGFILDEADQILESYGVIAKTKRENQISHRFISDEIKGLSVNARVTPTIFLSISAMIILVLLTRMVRHERTEIGLLKAYGYSSARVAAHYIGYALLLAGVGCIAGFGLGQYLANAMIELYVQFYQFPILKARMYPNVLAQSMGVALTFAVIGAIAAARMAARIRPAESMRPAAPVFGSRTILERIPALWNRLGFISKMIARNLARSPVRAAFNVFGVAVSCLVLMIAFFSSNAMDYMINFQFTEVQREDVTVNLTREMGKEALYEFQRMDHVRRVEPILLYPFTLRNGWKEKDVLITGLSEDALLQRLIDTDHNLVKLHGDGIVLSDYLAGQLGVAPGQEIEAEPLMGRLEKKKIVPVDGVTAQYLGNSVYMTIDSLSRLLDEPLAMNAVLVQTDPGGADLLNNHLKDIATVAAVAVKARMLQSLMDTLAMSMRIMNTMMIGFAFAIAFAIIYNVTIVSLTERERELASLRVLGFTQQETGSILYRENAVLGVLGIIVGLPLGVVYCRFMVYAFTTDLYRFPFYIAPSSYVITSALAIGFVLIANLAVRRRIGRLDMVEVLKSRE